MSQQAQRAAMTRALLLMDALCSWFGGLREHAVSTQATRGLRRGAVTLSTENGSGGWICLAPRL